jgi:hypothetical protein
LIPRFDGAILSLEWKEAAWDKFVTGALRPRMPSEQQYSDRKLRSRRYSIGFIHIAMTEVHTAKGKLYLFVGIDRTSTSAVTQLVNKAVRRPIDREFGLAA